METTGASGRRSAAFSSFVVASAGRFFGLLSPRQALTAAFVERLERETQASTHGSLQPMLTRALLRKRTAENKGVAIRVGGA